MISAKFSAWRYTGAQIVLLLAFALPARADPITVHMSAYDSYPIGSPGGDPTGYSVASVSPGDIAGTDCGTTRVDCSAATVAAHYADGKASVSTTGNNYLAQTYPYAQSYATVTYTVQVVGPANAAFAPLLLKVDGSISYIGSVPVTGDAFGDGAYLRGTVGNVTVGDCYSDYYACAPDTSQASFLARVGQVYTVMFSAQCAAIYDAICTASGTASVVFAPNFDSTGYQLAFSTSPVPEPDICSLLAIGSIALALTVAGRRSAVVA